MNRTLWNIKRTLRNTSRRIVKFVRSFFYTVTPSNLKKTSYPDLPAPIDWEKVANGRDICVEIGSGHGETLLANNLRKSIMIGYEIKARFFKLTHGKIRRRDDIFVYKGSGYESLFLHYRDEIVSRIFVLFPDPWHKKKHTKRRPLTAAFFSKVAQKLKIGGQLVIATDWQEYADFINGETSKVTSIYEIDTHPYSPEEFGLPITHYHQKWVRKGRKFTVIILKKKA